MENKVINELASMFICVKYPIRPHHINVGCYFSEAFEDVNMEVSARLLVHFYQEKKGWIAATKKELESFFGREFHFYGLCPESDEGNPDNFIVLGKDRKYFVTHKFIARCFLHNPSVNFSK